MKREDKVHLGLYWLGVAFVVACLAMALPGCATPDFCTLDEPGVDSAEAYIVSGQTSEADRATVQLRAPHPNGTEYWCTATKIGPHTLLTAAHCVDFLTRGADVIRVYSHGQPIGLGVDFEIHPEWGQDKPGPRQREAGDLAVVWTLGSLPGPSAALYRGEACYPGFVAQGYGVDENGELGGLRERIVYETHHTRWFIYTTEGPCYGDSGGPIYIRTPDDRLVIAGVSTGVARGCRGSLRLPRHGTAAYVNLTRYIHWVEVRIR